MGEEGIPNLGHLIIAPLSLIEQWRYELKAFFAPNTIDIYTLASNQAAIEELFHTGGKWATAPQPFINRICLCPLSVRILL